MSLRWVSTTSLKWASIITGLRRAFYIYRFEKAITISKKWESHISLGGASTIILKCSSTISLRRASDIIVLNVHFINFSVFLNALRCSLSRCVKTILENKIAAAFLKV